MSKQSKNRPAFNIPAFLAEYDSDGQLKRDQDGNGYLGSKAKNASTTSNTEPNAAFGSLQLDNFAQAGFNYARHGAPIPQMSDEFELLAFNAGISNANIKNGSSVRPLTGLNKNPARTSISDSDTDAPLLPTEKNKFSGPRP